MDAPGGQFENGTASFALYAFWRSFRVRKHEEVTVRTRSHSKIFDAHSFPSPFSTPPPTPPPRATLQRSHWNKAVLFLKAFFSLPVFLWESGAGGIKEATPAMTLVNLFQLLTEHFHPKEGQQRDKTGDGLIEGRGSFKYRRTHSLSP